MVEKDNEDNAVLGLQIIREILQKGMQSFDAATLDRLETYLLRQFQDFKTKFNNNFGSEPEESKNHGPSSPAVTPSPAPNAPTPVPEQSESSKRGTPHRQPKIPNKDSFKVVSEAYIITLITMGLYSKRPKHKIIDFMPHIVEALCLMPSKEAQERLKDKEKEKLTDFLTAQNKMYSIVCYLLRVPSASDLLQKYAKKIADSSIVFLKNCQPEHSTIRKSMLASLKHLAITYIDAYLEHFDEIMDYDVLVGENIERQDLRTEASVVILNVAQYTREKTTTEQKELIIDDLLRMINDTSITITLQSSAVLTLNRYIDIISHMPDCVSPVP